MKRTLNDRIIKALKPASAGTRYEVKDTVLPGFRVRVTEKRRCTYMLRARYPGMKHSSRREIGDCGAISLEAARGKARRWLELIKQGIDPQLEEERSRLAEQQQRQNSFAAVAEDFIRQKLPEERKGREIEHNIRRELIPAWGRLPINGITDGNILDVVEAKARTAPAQARNLLGTVKRVFAWAKNSRNRRRYGLTVSPASDLKPSDIVGTKRTRDRILTEPELLALWRAAERTPYPAGPIYKLLVLTGLRLNETADAHWSEFDLASKLWVIPKERMKGKNGKARAHAVPLVEDVLAVLDALPRFDRGGFLFSTRAGSSPVWMGSKVKGRMDARMLRTLRALARRRGEDPKRVALAPWTNHDIRRSVRSQLSRLKVTEEAREAVLAHARPGLKGIYDLHDYLDEKREALQLWHARLRSLVKAPPANVVALKAVS
jgi:integrase